MVWCNPGSSNGNGARVLDSDETEEPRLAPQMSTAHGMDHIKRWATGEVALPPRSGRGGTRLSDWRDPAKQPLP